jgi:magnesium-transporting ATPase (P-type)
MITVIIRIRADLKESQININVFLAFIPIAFLSYLFHEFGHWTFGEILGDDMVLSLNNAAPKSGVFSSSSVALWSAIGGPAFTILQAFIFFIIVKMTKSVYAYSVAFFAVFLRFYSILFGGLISLQDEVRIASMLGINKFIITGIVLLLLTLILWRCNKAMKFSFKNVGYYVVVSVIAILAVIGTYALVM